MKKDIVLKLLQNPILFLNKFGKISIKKEILLDKIFSKNYE